MELKIPTFYYIKPAVLRQEALLRNTGSFKNLWFKPV